MALNPEEFREKRQKSKEAREKQQKLLRLRLGIAGGLLVLCAVIILALAAGPKPPDPATLTETAPTQPPEATQPQQDPEQPPPETTQPQTVIRFVAGGDINVNDSLVHAGGVEYDFDSVFMDVAPILADGDLTTVNFEGNLCGAPFGSTASAPQTLMDSLRKAGVDMVQLANSYAINRGVSGLLTTIDGVRQAGMEPVGVFIGQQEYQTQQGFTMFEVAGVRVAVVAFTKGMDGTTLPPGNESCVNVLYSDYDSVYQKVDKEKINQVMTAVNQAQPDVTIALLHWGSEFNDTISSTQKTIKNLLLAQGVDAIIGTHPHYVQQIEFDPEAGTLVAYSIGDLVSDAQRAGSEYSIILELEITKDNATGQAALTGYQYTPIFSVVQEGEPVRVMRIREAMAAYESGYMDAVSTAIYEDMAYALQRIEARVAGQ